MIELLLVAVVVAGLAATAGQWWRPRLPVIRQRVLIPLREPVDHAVRGVVLRVRGPWVILGEAVLLRPGPGDRPTEIRMAGDVVIHQANAVMFQADPR